MFGVLPHESRHVGRRSEAYCADELSAANPLYELWRNAGFVARDTLLRTRRTYPIVIPA